MVKNLLVVRSIHTVTVVIKLDANNRGQRGQIITEVFALPRVQKTILSAVRIYVFTTNHFAYNTDLRFVQNTLCHSSVALQQDFTPR